MGQGFLTEICTGRTSLQLYLSAIHKVSIPLENSLGIDSGYVFNPIQPLGCCVAACLTILRLTVPPSNQPNAIYIPLCGLSPPLMVLCCPVFSYEYIYSGCTMGPSFCEGRGHSLLLWVVSVAVPPLIG